MTNNSIVRNDKYYIHSYEADLTTRLRFAGLNRYMQESAWKSAEQLGFGFSRLIKKKLAWVLTRMVVSIDHLPGWNKSIKIATWPSGRDAIFGFRDFQFFDEEGKELGRVARLEINFLAEALYKHAIVVRTEEISATEYRHSIVQTNDDLEICRAKTLWR